MSAVSVVSTNQMWCAVDHMPLVDLVAGDIAVSGNSPPDIPVSCLNSAEEYVVVDDRYAVAAATLRALHSACLVAAAARKFAPLGGTTVAVIGSGLQAELQVITLVRHVLGISHVAIAAPATLLAQTVTSRVVDELDLAGIGYTGTCSTREAVFGANLVLITPNAELDIGDSGIANGSVVINASNPGIASDAMNGISQVFVDDERPILESDVETPRTHWLRRDDVRFLGDLRKAFTGEPVRWDLDRTLLVDLLGADVPSPLLARRLCAELTHSAETKELPND